MKQLIRNKETGILEVWENGKKIDEVITMGDELSEIKSKNKEFPRNERKIHEP